MPYTPFQDYDIILTSPGGIKYKVGVADDGSVHTTLVDAGQRNIVVSASDSTGVDVTVPIAIDILDAPDGNVLETLQFDVGVGIVTSANTYTWGGSFWVKPQAIPEGYVDYYSLIDPVSGGAAWSTPSPVTWSSTAPYQGSALLVYNPPVPVFLGAMSSTDTGHTWLQGIPLEFDILSAPVADDDDSATLEHIVATGVQAFPEDGMGHSVGKYSHLVPLWFRPTTIPAGYAAEWGWGKYTDANQTTWVASTDHPAEYDWVNGTGIVLLTPLP